MLDNKIILYIKPHTFSSSNFGFNHQLRVWSVYSNSKPAKVYKWILNGLSQSQRPRAFALGFPLLHWATNEMK